MRWIFCVHAVAWYTRRSFLQIDTPAECSCDCCEVIARRPTEVVADVAVTCAPSKARGDECANQCRTAQGDVVLSAAGDTMDVARYCFFECKPTQGSKAKIASSCLALSAEEQRALTDRSGNALDPATLAVAPVPASVSAVPDGEFVAAVTPAFLQVSETPTEPTLAEAMEPVDAMAAAAGTQAAATKADMQVLRAKEVAQMPEEAQLESTDLSSIRDILADKVASQKAAEEAGIEAGHAEAALIEGRKEALEGGVAAGKSAMEAVKTADIGAAKDLADWRKRFMNTPEMGAIAAAAKAAEPFHLSMTRAQNTVSLYTGKANADMATAKGLQAEATALAAKANAAASPADAQAFYDQAKAKAAEAQEYAKNADNSFKTADQMNLDMPKYVGAAQAAAAKAAFDSMPAWQPAPPPAGLMGGFR